MVVCRWSALMGIKFIISIIKVLQAIFSVFRFVLKIYAHFLLCLPFRSLMAFLLGFTSIRSIYRSLLDRTPPEAFILNSFIIPIYGW